MAWDKSNEIQLKGEHWWWRCDIVAMSKHFIQMNKAKEDGSKNEGNGKKMNKNNLLPIISCGKLFVNANNPSRCGDFPDSIINVVAFVVKPTELLMISSFVYEILTYTRSMPIRIHRNRMKKKHRNCCRFFLFVCVCALLWERKSKKYLPRIGRNYIIHRIPFILSVHTEKIGYSTWNLGIWNNFYIFRIPCTYIDLIFNVFNFSINKTTQIRIHRRFRYNDDNKQTRKNIQLSFLQAFVTLRNNKFILHVTW